MNSVACSLLEGLALLLLHFLHLCCLHVSSTEIFIFFTTWKKFFCPQLIEKKELFYFHKKYVCLLRDFPAECNCDLIFNPFQSLIHFICHYFRLSHSVDLLTIAPIQGTTNGVSVSVAHTCAVNWFEYWAGRFNAVIHTTASDAHRIKSINSLSTMYQNVYQ